MSMLPELVEKFQSFIDNWTKGVQELVDDIFGEENENENEPILVSNTMYCQFLITAAGYEVVPTTWNNYCRMIYTCDLKVFNNTITVDVNPLGRFKGSKVYWDNIGGNAEACESAINQQVMETFEVYKARNEDVYVRYSQYDCAVSLYYGTPPSYHDGEVYKRIKNDRNEELKSYYCYPYFNLITYTIDGNGYIDVDTQYLDPWTDRCACIKTHPVVMTCNNPSTITQYVTDSGSTNNYHTTYTTTGGDTIDVYYGDSYIIVNNNGNDTSYDDLKNMLDIAINQINEDNDTDIKVPTYRENKYGPEPPTPPDYSDDNFGLTTTGFSSNIGGAGNYWLMSLANLAGFISDFKTTAPAGAMISQNILSCYVNALNYEWETGQDNIVIHAAGAQNTPYTSTSQYDYIYQYNPHVVVGQYKVPRVTETFYDFNPYSTYELYIPFCGWIGLPDTVAGRNIRVYMDFDVATMSCKAYVMVEMEDGSGATICGEITGSFGAPCPVQVIEGGLYKQAMINSGLQIASGVVSGLMGGAFGGPVGASMLATGGMNAVQGLASAYMAGNTNYGQTIGRAGDTSGLCGGHYCYIKITHPVIDEVVDTETFGHTTGYPCYMESELTDLVGTGFTVCLNPHVHVNCTQSEKDEIKQLLESGVIL